jgi:thiol-disulfide isomerase/thioredoxin
MRRFRLLFAVVVAVTFAPVASAELPTPDTILQIHRANRSKLSRLHLQLVQTEEATEAEAAASQKSDEGQTQFRDAAAKMLQQSKVEDLEIQIDGKTLKGEEAKTILTAIVAQGQNTRRRNPRQEWKAFRMFTPMEFFLNGDDYQFRQTKKHFASVEELAEWKFQDVPLTAETLATNYRETTIFSRSHQTSPPSRWWSCGSVCNAYIMQKHLSDVNHVHLPPYTEVTGSRWDCRHAYDHFFSQSADKYRVIRQEQTAGLELTVVDVDVPIGADTQGLLCYRAWLDLKRGATPIKVFHSQGVAGEVNVDRFAGREPSEIISTHEVRELFNGAFYPAKVVLEQWGPDPATPQLTKEEAAEVRAGHRKLQRVVHRRRTWECTLVDAQIQFNDSFFVLPFSPDEKIFDHDAEKMIGALESQPVPKIGQQAPPLTIARWLDGRQRTLDDLKGQVVVLDFWGLWCSACRNDVATQKIIQEKFRDQPVVFIAIHSAEGNTDALAARIAEFQKQKGWNVLAAIDSGRMVEDSVTTTAYGVDHFPFQVVIGPDGKIVYADPAADGPDCDETNPVIMAAFEKTFHDFWELRFNTVGEPWPLKEGLDEKAQQEIYERVQLKYVIQLIESAIPKK